MRGPSLSLTAQVAHQQAAHQQVVANTSVAIISGSSKTSIKW